MLFLLFFFLLVCQVDVFWIFLLFIVFLNILNILLLKGILSDLRFSLLFSIFALSFCFKFFDFIFKKFDLVVELIFFQ